MKDRKFNLGIVLLIIPVVFAGWMWVLGYFGGKEVTLVGPYELEKKTEKEDENTLVFFRYPKFSEDKLVDSYQLIDFYSLKNVFEDKQAWLEVDDEEFKKYVGMINKKEKKAIISYQFTKVQQGLLEKKPFFLRKTGFGYSSRLNFFGFLAKSEELLKKIDFRWVVILGYLILVSMFFSKSGTLLFIWWWWVVWLFIGEAGFFAVWRAIPERSLTDMLASPIIVADRTHFGGILSGWSSMYGSAPALTGKDPILFWLLFIVVVIVPVVGVFTGIVYLTKHVFPKRKREIEDFLKIDKDKGKRSELSIEHVSFKEVNYNIRNKLEKHKNTPNYFLGVDDKQADIVVDGMLMNHHSHILGATGSGKTSQIILPLAWQALDKGCGAAFLDFKGDEVLKKIVYKKAKEKGKKFYYFSIDPDEQTLFYNPLHSGDVHSKVDRIMSALELIYEGAASFYSNVQTMTFTSLLKKLEKEGEEITFKKVVDYLKQGDVLDEIGVEEKEVKGLLAALSRLADKDILNQNQISFEEIIKNEDVVFLALKSQVNTQLAEAIGRMMIIDFKNQAVKRKEIDPNYFIFIDEFQNLASPHFVDVISKVRSANFCLVLSNQSRGNLIAVDKAFENTVFSNTAIKIIFAQEDPSDARFWSDKTGKTQYTDRGMRVFAGSTFGGDKTMLDGKREVEGNVQKLTKNFISENMFFKLPKSKSIIFIRHKTATLANHEFMFSREERDRILQEEFGIAVDMPKVEQAKSKEFFASGKLKGSSKKEVEDERKFKPNWGKDKF